ncbi:hypothetical protein LINPERPRIM_LOCUS10045 [Linum perenne]
MSIMQQRRKREATNTSTRISPFSSLPLFSILITFAAGATGGLKYASYENRRG